MVGYGPFGLRIAQLFWRTPGLHGFDHHGVPALRLTGRGLVFSLGGGFVAALEELESSDDSCLISCGERFGKPSLHPACAPRKDLEPYRRMSSPLVVDEV